MINRWSISEIDKSKILDMVKHGNLSVFLATILYSKNITEKNEISSLISNDLNLADALCLKDIQKAAERINSAVENGEKICIFGDYDTDGICSTVLLFSYLRDQGADVIYYIPDRKTEGYGLNCHAIDYLANCGTKLIITVDNGISSIKEADYVKTKGLELIITDHHQQHKDTLPYALAIVNPHQHDCKSKFKSYAGVAVCFKLICALEGENLNINLLLDNYAELIALGTIADLVPLVEENRSLVKYALSNIKNTSSGAIKALLDESGLSENKISAQNLSFSVIPKLNVMGRLSNVHTAVKLLLSDDYDTAYSIAQELSSINNFRKKLDNDIFSEIEQLLLEENSSIFYDKVLVINGSDWHEGVIGIVASKIVAKYNKPCIIITQNKDNPGISKASGRSVKGFSIYDLIYECRDLLVKFGGHPMAIGFSLETKNINQLKACIKNYCQKFYPGTKMPIPNLDIVCKLNVSALNLKIVNEIKKLEPFGLGNEEPVFSLSSLKLLSIIPLANDKHLKLIVEKNGIQITLLYFFTSTNNFPYQISDVLDFAVTFSENCFNNSKSLSIIVRDVRLSGLNWDNISNDLNLFESFKRGETISSAEKLYLKPSRENMAVVYKYLKNQPNRSKISIFKLFQEISQYSDINISKLLVSLEIMSELCLVKFINNNYLYSIKLLTVKEKQSLDSSEILKSLSSM